MGNKHRKKSKEEKVVREVRRKETRKKQMK